MATTEELQYSHLEEVETIWQKIKAAFNNAGEKFLGFCPHRKKQWMREKTWLLIERRREAKIDRDNALTRTQKSERARLYSGYIKHVHVSCKRDKSLWHEHQAEKAESAAEIKDLRLLNYEITREIDGKNPCRIVKLKIYSIISLLPTRAERFKELFSDILNNTDFSSRHQSKAIQPPSPIVSRNHTLMSRVPHIPEIINAKGARLLVTIPKIGDLSQCRKYRGIMLLSIPSKVVTRELLNRIDQKLDAAIKKQQADFRPNRSYVDQINTLRIIVEQSVVWHKVLHLPFVDNTTAFDSVRRECILDSLKQ